MATVAQGLCGSRFTYSLDKTAPKSFFEFLVRAQKYIRAEEAAATRHDGEDRGASKKNKNGGGLGPRQPDRDPSRSQLTMRPRSPNKYDNYTPLVAPRSQIFIEIEKEEYVRRPPPMRAPPHSRN